MAVAAKKRKITSPAALAAAVEIRANTRKRKVSGRATLISKPIEPAPAADSTNQRGRARIASKPIHMPPAPADHVELGPYVPTPEVTETVAAIIDLHRSRQSDIRARTKLILQATAIARSMLCSADDYEEDTSTERVTAYGRAPRKISKTAKARVDAAMKEAIAECKAATPLTPPTTPLALCIAHYVSSIELFDAREAKLKKDMVRLVKTLPVYPWAASVKGFGDVSLATIIGECGDIGTYKSVSAVWKRLGLAPYKGKAGRTWRVPHERGDAPPLTAEEWVELGYVKQRRSVSWNARKQIICGMGLWRPVFGEDVRANTELTEYQKVFAERARYESSNLEAPIEESDKGKESYTQHVINRAFRYTEKRLLKHLYLEWRRAQA